MKKLPKALSNEKRPRLGHKELPFRISIETRLSNGYEIKDMDRLDVAELHRFVADTVYKKLSISKVDELYLRKEGMGNAPPVTHNGIELLHYGKARKPFRIFGYFNEDAYFVICRIDGKHNTHKD